MSSLVNDLAVHVLEKHARAMTRALDLLEDETNSLHFAFMMTVVGSEITTLVATLTASNPAMQNLDERTRRAAVLWLLARALDADSLTVQQVSDMMACAHAYPEVELR